MKNLIGLLVVIVLSFTVSCAQADEAAGKITAIDSQTLVLEDGTTFKIGEGVSIEGLEPNASVTVSYEDQNGNLVATDITTEGGDGGAQKWP